MGDLNFFEPYLKEKRSKTKVRLISSGIVILIAVPLIIFVIYNMIEINRVSKDLYKLEQVVCDERLNERVKAIQIEEDQMKGLRKSFNEIQLIEDTLEDLNVIDDLLLNTITSRMPEKLFFTSINMSPNNIKIIGISQDRQSIAQLGKSLETIKEFKDVFISSISREEIYYKFNLSISLKDVKIDERNKDIKDL